LEKGGNFEVSLIQYSPFFNLKQQNNLNHMLETIFQNPTQQVLSKYKPYVNQINALESKFKLFADSELREKNKRVEKSPFKW
jgi:hypothetical protein